MVAANQFGQLPSRPWSKLATLAGLGRGSSNLSRLYDQMTQIKIRGIKLSLPLVEIIFFLYEGQLGEPGEEHFFAPKFVLGRPMIYSFFFKKKNLTPIPNSLGDDRAG